MPKTVEDVVRETLVEQLCVDDEEVTANAHLVDDLGCDSLDVVEIVMSFEEHYDIEISDVDAEKLHTVGDFVAYLKPRVEK